MAETISRPSRKVLDNLYVGPQEAAAEYGWDVIINVNDAFPNNPEPSEARLFWVPINEASFWGYEPFFAVKRIMDHFMLLRRKILVHCAAGAHRSPAMICGWMISTGHSEKQIREALGDGVMDKFYRDVEENFIPDDLSLFYEVMNEYPEWCLMSILSELAHRRRYRCFMKL